LGLLYPGDSTAFPKISRLKIHLFRTKAEDDPFSATIDITAIPDAAKKSIELMARPICGKSRQKRRSLLPRKGVSASVMFCRSEQAPVGG
jgi:hypothetical protein